MEHGVRVGDEVFETGVGDQFFNAFGVGAFGQPDAARTAPEVLAVVGDGDLDLRAACCRGGDERQEAVRRTAGDQLDSARRLQRAKSADEIVLIDFMPESLGRAQILVVHARRVVKLRQLAEGAVNLFLGEGEQVFEVARVARLQ